MKHPSDKPLIFVAGSGTTGTRSIYAGLCMMGFHAVHFDVNCNWGPPPEGESCCSGDSRVPLAELMEGLTETPREKMYHMSMRGEAEWIRDTGGFKKLWNLPDKAYRDANYKQIFEHIDAVLDTPYPSIFPYFVSAFPNIKVILTLRDADVWVKHRFHDHPGTPHEEYFLYPEYWRKALNASAGWKKMIEDPKHPYESLKVFEQELVMRYFYYASIVPPEQLLVIDLFGDEEVTTWKRLAEFVDRPVPSVDAHGKMPRPSPKALRPQFYNDTTGVIHPPSLRTETMWKACGVVPPWLVQQQPNNPIAHNKAFSCQGDPFLAWEGGPNLIPGGANWRDNIPAGDAERMEALRGSQHRRGIAVTFDDGGIDYG